MATLSRLAPVAHLDTVGMVLSKISKNSAWVVLSLGCGIMTVKATNNYAGSFFRQKKMDMAIVITKVVAAMLLASRSPLMASITFVALCIIRYVKLTKPKRAVEGQGLPSYMMDMVEAAKNKEFPSLIGYEEAVEQIELVMSSDGTNNVILRAKPGVGKSAIPETIAYNIADGKYPEGHCFKDAKLIRIEKTDLLAGTKWYGTIDERVQEMIKYSKTHPKVIYVLDEIQMFVNSNGSDEHITPGALLQPALARHGMRVIGMTTFDDYEKLSAAFKRRFKTIDITPPNRQQCFKMVRHRYDIACRDTPLKISDHAIAAAIFFAERDLQEQCMPAKVVELVDLAKASLRRSLPASEISIDVKKIAEIHQMSLPPTHKSKRFSVDELVEQFNRLMTHHPAMFPAVREIVNDIAETSNLRVNDGITAES